MAARERKVAPRMWQRGLFIHTAILESICLIADTTRFAGNQAMNAIQTMVNKTPKDRAKNELHCRTRSIV